MQWTWAQLGGDGDLLSSKLPSRTLFLRCLTNVVHRYTIPMIAESRHADLNLQPPPALMRSVGPILMIDPATIALDGAM